MNIIEQIEQQMTQPSLDLIADIAKIDGDIMILGVSGKMGYHVASLLLNAIRLANCTKTVYGVARFSERGKERYEALGCVTIAADFMKEEDLAKLPHVKNIIYMVGYKFGTQGNESFAWALNSYLPGRIAQTFPDSNIVVFSTGCVYPLVDVRYGAPSEEMAPQAAGEYAQSCLGRERVFEHFSKVNQTKMVIFRLNYAIDVRYGVLMEIANAVNQELPIDLRMGHVNVIWQPDACEYAIRSLLHAESPANVINITGPETLSVRWLAEQFGTALNKEPIFAHEEESTALLSNASKAHALMGYPKTSIRQMIQLISSWIQAGGEVADKPTHFQERNGNY